MIQLAGKGSELHKKHRVYMQMATGPQLPESCADRLSEMFPGALKHLHLSALDPYDLALSKLELNSEVDVEDVKHIARTIPFDLDVLRDRFETEVLPLLGNPDREAWTLQIWTEAIEEERALRK